MELFIAPWRPLVEFLYFLSQICLAAGLVLAYRQLKTVKQDSLLRIKRTGAEKAIEACERYVNVVLPQVDEFYVNCKSKGLKSYKKAIGDFSSTSLAGADLDAATARLSVLESGSMLNQLEMMAAILVSGVGDEAVAFPVIGQSYCDTIEKHYDLICLCRGGAWSNSYQNMIELYHIWQSRKKKLDLSAQKARLDASIAGIPDKKIVPLEER